MLKVGEAFKTSILVTDASGLPATGKTISYTIYDETHTVFATGSLTEIEVDEEGTGVYYVSWTPDAVGYWIVEFYYNNEFRFYDARLYQVGSGLEADILADTNELQADFHDGGRLDLLIDAIKAKTDIIGASVALESGGNLATVLADTNELQTDWKNGGRLDLIIDAIQAKTDLLFSGIATEAKQDTIDSVVDSIKAKTDLIGVSVAPEGEYDTEMARITGNVALDSTVAKEATLTHATYGLDKIKTETGTISSDLTTVDGIVDAIKAKTDNIGASVALETGGNLATVLADTNELQTDWANGGRLDLLLDAVKAKTDLIVSGGATEANVDAVESKVDAIKLKTDLLFSGIATEAKQNTIIGYIDTEIGAIKTKTDLIGASVAPASEYDTEMARITGNVALEATLTAIKGTGWTTETLKAIYDSIGGLNDITAASVWSVGTRALTDKANFTLASSEYTNVRLSVCATGDTANSIGKILYDFYNTRLSATRCGYIDYLASGTYGLPALNTDLDSIIASLANATYGLSALKTLIDTVDTVADAIKLKTDLLFSGIATEAKQNTIIGYIDTEVGAIKAKTDLIGASVATAGEYTSALSTIDGYFDVTTADATTDATIRDVIGRKTDTANTTVGTTSSLMRYTKGILGLLTNATYGLSALETLVDDLEGRLTSTRAGYLDYLASGTYGLSALKTLIDTVDTVCDNIYSKVDTEIATIDTVVDAIKVNSDKLPRLLSFVDSWGTNNSSITITTTAGTKTLTSPSVVVAGIPSGATVTKVVALLKIASITDTSGADNAIVGSTMVLQCDAASEFTSPTTAISIPDNSWAIDVDAGQTRGGDAIIGSEDIKAEVTGNGTYYFRFINADCDGNNLILNDVLVGLRVYFTI